MPNEATSNAPHRSQAADLWSELCAERQKIARLEEESIHLRTLAAKLAMALSDMGTHITTGERDCGCVVCAAVKSALDDARKEGLLS